MVKIGHIKHNGVKYIYIYTVCVSYTAQHSKRFFLDSVRIMVDLFLIFSAK